MGAQQSTQGKKLTPEEVSFMFAQKCAKQYSALEIWSLKKVIGDLADREGGVAYWKEDTFLKYFGIPDDLDVGRLLFKSASTLAAFPFVSTLAPAPLTADGFVKVLAFYDGKYRYVLKESYNVLKLIFVSFATIERDPRDQDDANNDDDDGDDDLVVYSMDDVATWDEFDVVTRLDRADATRTYVPAAALVELFAFALALADVKPYEDFNVYFATRLADPSARKKYARSARSMVQAMVGNSLKDDTVVRFKEFESAIKNLYPNVLEPLGEFFDHMLYTKHGDRRDSVSKAAIGGARVETKPAHAESTKGTDSTNIDKSGDDETTKSGDGETEETSKNETEETMEVRAKETGDSGAEESGAAEPANKTKTADTTKTSEKDSAEAPPSDAVPSAMPPAQHALLCQLSTFLGPEVFDMIKLYRGSEAGFSLRAFETRVFKWAAPTVLIVHGRKLGSKLNSSARTFNENVPSIATLKARDEKRFTFGAYVESPWRATSKDSFANDHTLLFELLPRHNLYQARHSEPGAYGYFSWEHGIGFGNLPPKGKKIVPGNVGLILDKSLEHGVFRAAGPGGQYDMGPASNGTEWEDRFEVDDIIVWGLGSTDELEAQKKRWAWEEAEAERRKHVNIGDMREERVLLEMAGLVGKYGDFSKG